MEVQKRKSKTWKKMKKKPLGKIENEKEKKKKKQ